MSFEPFNKAIGGGFRHREGHIHLIIGPSHSTKTIRMLNMAADARAAGLIVMIVAKDEPVDDTARKLVPMLRARGIRTLDIPIVDKGTVEEHLSILKRASEATDRMGCIAIDSIQRARTNRTEAQYRIPQVMEALREGVNDGRFLALCTCEANRKAWSNSKKINYSAAAKGSSDIDYLVDSSIFVLADDECAGEYRMFVVKNRLAPISRVEFRFIIDPDTLGYIAVDPQIIEQRDDPPKREGPVDGKTLGERPLRRRREVHESQAGAG